MNTAERETIALTLERCRSYIDSYSASDAGGRRETLLVRLDASLALLKAPEGAMTPDMEADLIPTDRLIQSLQRRTTALLVFGHQARGKEQSGYLRALHGEPTSCIGLAHTALVQAQGAFDRMSQKALQAEAEKGRQGED